MLYVIIHGYLGVNQLPQEDLVYIGIKIEDIKRAGLEYVYTNMNAKIALAEFYNTEENFSKLDWERIRTKFWKNTEEDLARKDLKQKFSRIKDLCTEK